MKPVEFCTGFIFDFDSNICTFQCIPLFRRLFLDHYIIFLFLDNIEKNQEQSIIKF